MLEVPCWTGIRIMLIFYKELYRDVRYHVTCSRDPYKEYINNMIVVDAANRKSRWGEIRCRD